MLLGIFDLRELPVLYLHRASLAFQAFGPQYLIIIITIIGPGCYLLARCDLVAFLGLFPLLYFPLTISRTTKQNGRSSNHFYKVLMDKQSCRTAYSQYSPHVCDFPNAVTSFHFHWSTVSGLRHLSPRQACPCRLSVRRVIMYASFVARLEVAWMAEPMILSKIH